MLVWSLEQVQETSRNQEIKRVVGKGKAKCAGSHERRICFGRVDAVLGLPHHVGREVACDSGQAKGVQQSCGVPSAAGNLQYLRIFRDLPANVTDYLVVKLSKKATIARAIASFLVNVCFVRVKLFVFTIIRHTAP